MSLASNCNSTKAVFVNISNIFPFEIGEFSNDFPFAFYGYIAVYRLQPWRMIFSWPKIGAIRGNRNRTAVNGNNLIIIIIYNMQAKDAGIYSVEIVPNGITIFYLKVYVMGKFVYSLSI